MEEENWDPEKTYDQNPPAYIRYWLQWKVMKNGRTYAKDEKPDVVVSPECYWRKVIEAERKEVIEKKFPGYSSSCPDESIVVVSVTEPRKQPFTKKFKKREVEWRIVEKYLRSWTQYFERGRELRVVVSYNYEISPQSATRSAGQAGKRGRTSATTRMLGEMSQFLGEEQRISGQPSKWPEVYKIMECSRPSCDPHCLINPDGKNHVRLNAVQLRELAEFVRTTNATIKSHNDVPPYLRERWIAAEEHEQEERRARAAAKSSRNGPPIQITNVLPSHAQQTSTPDVELGSMSLPHPSNTTSNQRFEISRPRDDRVREYTEWQKSQVRDPLQKEAFDKACNAALKVGYDLDWISQKKDEKFFIGEDVLPGIAWSFCHDASAWNQLN